MGESDESRPHNFCCVILVAIRFHIPYYLMAKKLRDLCRLEDEARDVACPFCQCLSSQQEAPHTEVIITKGLDNLRDEEESNVDRVLFQNSVGILQH